MAHLNVRGVAVVILIAVVGCGGSAPAPGDTQAAVDGAAFCRQLAALMTEKGACLPASQPTLAMDLDVERSCARIAAALAAGRITYDRQQATTCLSSVREMPCGVGFTNEQVHVACAAALPGHGQTGEPCHRLWHSARLSDCATDHFCNTVGVCPGICQRFAQANESCDNLHPCRLDLMCGTSDGRCHARPAAGGACVNLDAQAAYLPELTAVLPCPVHQYCSRATLTCTPNVADGDVCMPAEGGCQDYCATNSLSTPGTCLAVGGPGASCANLTASVRAYNGQLSLSQVPTCGYGLGCRDGTCRERPTVGQPCDSGLNHCATGSFCGAEMLCEALPPSPDADCYPGTVCGHPGEVCCGPVVVSLEAPYVSGGCASGASCGANGLCP